MTQANSECPSLATPLLRGIPKFPAIYSYTSSAERRASATCSPAPTLTSVAPAVVVQANRSTLSRRASRVSHPPSARNSSRRVSAKLRYSRSTRDIQRAGYNLRRPGLQASRRRNLSSSSNNNNRSTRGSSSLSQQVSNNLSQPASNNLSKQAFSRKLRPSSRNRRASNSPASRMAYHHLPRSPSERRQQA